MGKRYITNLTRLQSGLLKLTGVVAIGPREAVPWRVVAPDGFMRLTITPLHLLELAACCKVS